MADPRLGRYVYCVIDAADRPPLTGLAGVDPKHGVEVVAHGGLSALVSAVSLEEFGADALKANLEQLEWVERTARAHNAVLDRVLAVTALVPLRLCTIFVDDEHVRAMLERERDVLRETLRRVRGRAEWSVKVIADRPALEAAARERSGELAAMAADSEGQAPGRAYLVRKKLDRLVREEAGALAETAAGEIHARLQEEATAATLLPPPHPELTRRAGEMVMNAAYLVDRAREAPFAAVVGELDDRHRPLGLELRLSGPWAPYNFTTAASAAP